MDKLAWGIFGMDAALAISINLLLKLHPAEEITFAFIYLVMMFAFRSFDLQYLSSFKQQLIRNAIAAFFSAVLSLTFMSFLVLLKALSLSAAAVSILNPLIFKILLGAYPKKTYFLPPQDYRDLEDILKEIEEKTFGKVTFKPANPHITEYPAEAVVSTSQEQAQEFANSTALADLAEKYLKRIPIEILLRFEDYYRGIFENIRDESIAKRLLDIVISLLGLVIFSPVMLIISIAILIEDGPPVIFKQERVGKNGRKFIVYKFRTLKGEPINPGHDVKERLMKCGSVVRKFRLDEIPQFVNVLKGDMSVIGPRPEMERFHSEMIQKIPFYHYRLKRKPGITGWAQINYKHTTTEEDYRKKTEYDLWYVKNRNFAVDLKIILQTVETMIGMRGAR